MVATATSSKFSGPLLRSKQVSGIGSQKSTPIVPDVEIKSQLPPFKTRSHPSPSEMPEITIVPSAVFAGLSPPMEPPEFVVREVIPASEPV